MNNINFDFIALLSNPDFWVTSIHKFVLIVIILFSFAFLLRLSTRTRELLVSKKVLSPTIALLICNIFKWLISTLFLLLILQQFGLSITNILAIVSTVIAMIAIGFVAVWSVLSNILCTLMLLIFQPFRIGDEIEIVDPAMTSGLGGVVRNINILFTTLRSSNEEDEIDIQIPNNLFFQKLIRRKIGKKTYSLEKQVFENRSLLREENKQS